MFNGYTEVKYVLIEDTGVIIHDLGFGKEFLDLTARVWATKLKTDKLDCIKVKKLVLQRTPSSKWKDNPQNVKNIYIWYGTYILNI